MMIYELAMVEDHGAYWLVNNVQKNTLDSLVDQDEKAVKLSHVSYKLINDALMEGKTVHIHKELNSDEVRPSEVEVLDHKETDGIQEARNAALRRIRMLVTPELAKISSFSLYGFTVLNNDLANAGYFITNDNREEKYLAILETGDEVLISKLEDYLNYKDEIEEVAHLERKFSQFRKDIKIANTTEQILKLQAQFLEKFFETF